VLNHIYSSAISTSEAIGAATRIKADMHSATVHDLSNVAHICDESQILHAAAGILRKGSFPIGTEVLSFADSNVESSSSQHMNISKRNEA
jgi:hypothetical protein